MTWELSISAGVATTDSHVKTTLWIIVSPICKSYGILLFLVIDATHLSA